MVKVKLNLNIGLLKSIGSQEDFEKKLNLKKIVAEKEYNIYIKRSPKKYPAWAEEIKEKLKIDILKNLNEKEAEGIIIFIPIEKDKRKFYFILTFGTGRFLLDQKYLNLNFGNFISKKLMKDGKIKAFSSREINQNPVNKKENYGKVVSFDELNRKIQNNEIMRDITLFFENKENFSKIMGKDYFLKIQIILEKGADNFLKLKNTLSNLLDVFHSIKEEEKLLLSKGIIHIEDEKLSEKLFNQMLYNILKERNNDFFFFEPDSDLDYSEVDSFLYKISKNKIKSKDFKFLEYLNNCKEITLENLKNDEIFLYNTSGNIMKKWKVLDCLYGEMDYEKDKYILSNGKWTKVDKSKFNRIEKTVKDIEEQFEIKEETINLFKDEIRKKTTNTSKNKRIYRENIFNRVLSSSKKEYIFMDEQKKHITLESDQFEVCDVLDINKKEFIHVKIDENASNIGHLFNQGFVSGKSYVFLEDEFIKKVNEKINPVNIDKEFKTIRFLILTKKEKGRLTFFTKLVLDDKINTLRGFGFNLKLSWLNSLGDYL